MVAVILGSRIGSMSYQWDRCAITVVTDDYPDHKTPSQYFQPYIENYGSRTVAVAVAVPPPRPAVATDEARLPRPPSREVLDIRELSRAIREEAVARIQGTTVPRPAVVTDRA